MTYGIYVIRDAKTTFMLPTVDFNNASAMRNFEHAVRHPDSLMKSIRMTSVFIVLVLLIMRPVKLCRSSLPSSFVTLLCV